MKPSSWLLDILRDPIDGGRLDIGDILTQDEIVSLVYPSALSDSDQKMNRFYDRIAPFYSFFERFLGRILAGICIDKERKDIVSLLNLKKGCRLLEVSPGPGVFQQALRHSLGAEGQMVSLDLSMNMLKQCQKRNSHLNIELIQGNAQHLPFADESFDALFHFGGVNLFNHPEQALTEFIRVVRRGGLIAWGDEKMSDHFHHPIGRCLLPRLNTGYLKTPPAIPNGLNTIQYHEVNKGLGYLIIAIK